jgi:hypothetical protein
MIVGMAPGGSNATIARLVALELIWRGKAEHASISEIFQLTIGLLK